MGDTPFYGNRGLIRIGGRSQSRHRRDRSMSKPDFQIPHRDLSRLGGTESPGCFDFGNGVADLFFGGGKRFSSLSTASRRCCCAHPWPRPFGGGNRFPINIFAAPQRPCQDRQDWQATIIVPIFPYLLTKLPPENMELTKKPCRIMFDLSPVRMDERRHWISQRKTPASAFSSP
jgi:hypothetical protein